MDIHRHPGKRLMPVARVWRVTCGVLAGIDAYSWGFTPGFSITSYDWALRIAPHKVWAIVFLGVAVSCLYATIGECRGWPITEGLTRIAVGCYAVACGTVGLSILIVRGLSDGALSGAAKWWLVCCITGVLFGQPSLVDGQRR